MSIPDFQSIMLPLLQEISYDKEYPIREIIERLAKKFNLTSEDRKVLLPSGQQFVFDNRVGWARTYLYKAGLLEVPKRGIIRITERGKEVLNKKLNKIDVRFLYQFEEFRKFHEYKKPLKEDQQPLPEVEETFSPEEKIEKAYNFYNNSLITDILKLIYKLSPQAFEKLVVEVLVKMGYGGAFEDAAQIIGGTGDEGIDGLIKQDPLGLDVIYIQAKRWEAHVGRPELHKFVGALQGKHAQKGVFITTSDFTKDAIDYVKGLGGSKIILINGETLAKLMIKYNVGLTTTRVFEVKRIDQDYFEEY